MQFVAIQAMVRMIVEGEGEGDLLQGEEVQVSGMCFTLTCTPSCDYRSRGMDGMYSVRIVTVCSWPCLWFVDQSGRGV